jgi:hypothetical protein
MTPDAKSMMPTVGVQKRRQPDLHRRIAVLQTAALLLGYTAACVATPFRQKLWDKRETGFEPATLTLAR